MILTRTVQGNVMSKNCIRTTCSSFSDTSPANSSHTSSGKSTTTKSEESCQPSLKILVAEDEHISRMFISRLLEKYGHEVKAVKNGKEVLEALEKEGKFDALLTDIQMPFLNGVELTHILRTETTYQRHAQLAIIAMTAYAISGDRENFLKAGMDDYIPKPIDPKLLEIILQQVTASPH